MRIILPVIAFMLVLVGCSGSREYRGAQGNAWSTSFSITYDSDRPLDDSICSVMTRIDTTLSPFCKGSLICRVNDGETAVVDSGFATVFAKAQEIAALSGGRFDPTVGPLVNLWGFGSKTPSASEPTQAEIDSALASVGIADCALGGGLTITKKAPQTRFDFSAIAKGYGCDEVARMLERNGCRNYLVEIGGEIALNGVNRRGETWRVQIDAPIEGMAEDAVHQPVAYIQVTDCGIASSGNYRNYRDTDSGRRVGHTISPITGYPVQGELAAVTVIAPDAMTADALATACMAMPLDEARAMIEGLDGAEALFITADPDGGFNLSATEGFPEIEK